MTSMTKGDQLIWFCAQFAKGLADEVPDSEGWAFLLEVVFRHLEKQAVAARLPLELFNSALEILRDNIEKRLTELNH